MKTKTLGWIVVLGAAACSFVSCSQAKVECQVLLAGSGYSYATKYVLKSTPSAECMPLVQAGDLVGMEFYHPATADGLTYDSSKSTLALQADTVGNLIKNAGRTSATGKPYAIGAFTSVTPDDTTSMCSVPTVTAADQDFADIPAVPGVGGAGGGAMPPMDEVPEDHIKYEWKNIQIYVTAAAQGTQFEADLTYSETLTASDGTTTDCKFEYRAIGMGPAVACSKVDDMGAPVLDPNGKQQPDVSLCSPCTDKAAGRTIASGINPDFDTSCEPVFSDSDPFGRAAFYCVLKNTTAGATLPQLLTTSPVCKDDANSP